MATKARTVREKPITTIAYQDRQITNMAARIEELVAAKAAAETRVAELERQQRNANDVQNNLRASVKEKNHVIEELHREIARQQGYIQRVRELEGKDSMIEGQDFLNQALGVRDTARAYRKDSPDWPTP